jgi:hypothetical protein
MGGGGSYSAEIEYAGIVSPPNAGGSSMKAIVICVLVSVAQCLPVMAENISLDCQIAPADSDVLYYSVHIDVTSDGVLETKYTDSTYYTNEEEKSSIHIYKKYFSVTPGLIKYGSTSIFANDVWTLEMTINRLDGSYLFTNRGKPIWHGQCKKGQPSERRF